MNDCITLDARRIVIVVKKICHWEYCKRCWSYRFACLNRPTSA